MSAFKPDLQRVLAYKGYVVDSKLLVGKALDLGQPARASGLSAAFRAGACPAQPVGCIRAAMTALPRDFHQLRGAVDVHGDRERVWLFQWTLITGSWR